MFERRAVQILHGDEGAIVFFTDVMDSANVGMIQSGRGAGLTFESLQRLRIVRNIFGQELQSDEAA